MYAASSVCKLAAFEPEAANFSVLSQKVFLNRSGMLYSDQYFNLALSESISSTLGRGGLMRLAESITKFNNNHENYTYFIN